MAKLIIDTCSWLEISKPRFSEVLTELEDQVSKGLTVLLTSQIIIEEWDRNKDRIVNDIKASIRAHAKSALKLTEFLEEAEAKQILEIIEKYKSEEAKQE